MNKPRKNDSVRPSARRSKWRLYEERKKQIAAISTDGKEYEERIKKAAREMKI